jgi:two-component system LytT family response regulator
MKLRTLIVDDEPLARQNLSSLLASESDIEVIGECVDGDAALVAIERQRPDLLFLDIQMPFMNGFEVLAATAPDRLPSVIFVTAHDQFAVRAFETQAVDYLLKPFHRGRFQAALARVRAHLSARATATGARTEPAAVNRLMIKTGDRLVFLRFEQLDFIQADGNYVRIHADDQVYTVRDKIGALEAQLPAPHFIRVHRSYIVNLSAVTELVPDGNGDWIAVLHTGRHIPVGPSYPAAIQNALRNAGVPLFGAAAR